jgi:hypothetical protein
MKLHKSTMRNFSMKATRMMAVARPRSNGFLAAT